MPSLGCQQVRRFLLTGHRGRLTNDRELRVTPSCAILHAPRLSTAMPRYPEVEYIIGRNRVEPRVPPHLCIDTVLIRFLGLLQFFDQSLELKFVSS